MLAISAFLTTIPDQWKAISALVGAFAAGIALAGTMIGAQVAENTTTISVVRDSVAVVGTEVRDTNERLDEVLRAQNRTNCLIRLQVRGIQVDPLGIEEVCP